MQGVLTTQLMNFRFEAECREKLEKLAEHYGSKNKTKVLKRIIEDAYQAQIINPQTQTKEGN